MYVVASFQLNVNVEDCGDRVRGGNGSESKTRSVEWFFVSPHGELKQYQGSRSFPLS